MAHIPEWFVKISNEKEAALKKEHDIAKNNHEKGMCISSDIERTLEGFTKDVEFLCNQQKERFTAFHRDGYFGLWISDYWIYITKTNNLYCGSYGRGLGNIGGDVGPFKIECTSLSDLHDILHCIAHDALT